MKEKILITGASGFIGTNALEYFCKKGFEVINIDINKPQDKDYISFWRKIDIKDLKSFKYAVLDFNPDYIFFTLRQRQI